MPVLEDVNCRENLYSVLDSIGGPHKNTPTSAVIKNKLRIWTKVEARRDRSTGRGKKECDGVYLVLRVLLTNLRKFSSSLDGQSDKGSADQ